jgi:transposase
MAKMIKVVKVPVRIIGDNKEITHIKYRALLKIMDEARYLGNMAIRYAIAFSLKDVPCERDEQGKQLPSDTRIYRILTKERRHLDSGTVATLQRNFASKLFRSLNKDAWAGKKSLPTYTSSFVPFRHQATTIKEIDRNGAKQFIIEPAGFRGKWLSDQLISEVSARAAFTLDNEQRRLGLISTFSWKDRGSLEVMSSIACGEYNLSDSQIRRGTKGLMAYLTYSFEPVKPHLSPNKICGVELGEVVPAVCAVNFGPQRMYIGKGEDVWAAYSKFRSHRRRRQSRQGLYSKSKSYGHWEKEKNWIHTYYHALTRQVIKFCTQHGCGTIHIKDRTNPRDKEIESEFRSLLRIPSKFNKILEYKAKEQGIRIVKITPQNTSRKCSECGHISNENRKSQLKFVCKQCGDPTKPANADYNAAKNIALATGDA